MKLTVPEAARRAGRSPETIRRWIWKGKLRSEKVGNQHVVELEDLDALLGLENEEDEDIDLGAIPEAWRESFRHAIALRRALRERGVRLPAAADLVRESRRGH